MTVLFPIYVSGGVSNNYSRYGTLDPVHLRILEAIRVQMSLIEGVQWAEFYDGATAVENKAMPGVFIAESSNTNQATRSCAISIEEMTVRIGGLIRLTGEQRATNRWRDAIWSLAKDIEETVRANSQWSELARGTDVVSRQIHEPVEGLASCTITIQVTYGTAFNDLTVPA